MDIKKFILKIYLHPKSELRGFKILSNIDWSIECKAERSLCYVSGCSSMSYHESYDEAIDQARKELPENLFKICF